MDTVFDVGTVEKRPFRREGNKLYGPGVLDMKSGDLMILEIMRAFAGKLPEDFCLCGLLNCDEEIGSKQSKDKIMELGRNSVACLCMEPSKPGYCTVARKGLITFRVKTSGIAAHSGVNYHLGFSAIQGLCNIITKLYTLRDDERAISINIGGMTGGVDKGNIVADAASCIGEVRFYDPALTDSVLEKLHSFTAHTGVDNVSSELTIVAIRPPMQKTEASQALYEKARLAAEANGLELVGRTHGGGSDGSFVASIGTPVVDGMGAEGEFSHTVEEYVRVDTLMQRLQSCIDLIAALMK
jgi:glutamate carboxypeptidase